MLYIHVLGLQNDVLRSFDGSIQLFLEYIWSQIQCLTLKIATVPRKVQNMKKNCLVQTPYFF